MKKRIPLEDRLSPDVIQHVLSFLSVVDYQRSKFYLSGACRCAFQEKKIALMKRVYRAMPLRYQKLSGTRYNLKYREVIDCQGLYEKEINFFDKDLKRKLHGVKFKTILYVKNSSTVYHFIMWT